MAFFTQEGLELMKQPAQTTQLVSSKKECDNIKQNDKDRKVKFEGIALQSVGVIPRGSKVTLMLNPEMENITIKYDKDISITLPYTRVLGFRVEYTIENADDKAAKLTGSVLSSGLLGRGVVGKAGRLAGDMMMVLRKTKAIWIGVLIYKDKNGETNELSFFSHEQDLEFNQKPNKSYEDEVFEHTVNLIALRNNAEMMEL